jgi:hypothetical protein
LFEHVLFAKPVPTFAGHALALQRRRQSRRLIRQHGESSLTLAGGFIETPLFRGMT